jgi:hypothetical protein
MGCAANKPFCARHQATLFAGRALRAACRAGAGLGLSPAANDARGVIDGLTARLPSAKGKQAECGAPGQRTKEGGCSLRRCDRGEP